MQIEEGKFYRTREGVRVGPAVATGKMYSPWNVGGREYPDSTGHLDRSAYSKLDLVAEDVEAPVVPVEGDFTMSALAWIARLKTCNERALAVPQVRLTKAEIDNALDDCIAIARAALLKMGVEHV